MNDMNSIIPDSGFWDEILDADKTRITALVNRDKALLGDILSDELIYVHSSGRDETKEPYISRILDGLYDYRSFVTTRRDLRVLGELAFDNGDADIDIVVNGSMREISSRYLMVWRKENGRWKLFRFHSSPIPRESTTK